MRKNPKTIHNEAVSEFLKRPGITGVSRGIKLRNGRLTKENSLVIYVSEKKRKEHLSKDEIIPAKYEGLITDVQQAKWKLHAYTSYYTQMNTDQRDSPKDRLNILHPGLSIGPYDADQAGTLGPLVQDAEGTVYGMTCWHVLATLATGVLYDTAASPSKLDVGEYFLRQVGDTGSYILNQYGDAVLIQLSVDAINEALRLHKSCYVGSDYDATLGHTVIKMGRTTGVTYGHAIADGIIEVDYSDFGIVDPINMRCMTILGYDDIPMVSDSGDSGAAWISLNGNVTGAVGLHVAGTELGDMAVACFLDDVCDQLNVLPVQAYGGGAYTQYVWGNMLAAEETSSVYARGSFVAVLNNKNLVLRATSTQEKYYLPRFTLVDEEYVEDENGAYVQDPDDPDVYILLAEHPTGGYYTPVEEVLADSGVHYI